MSRLTRLFDWFQIYGYLGYYSGGGDNDRDGIPDRADVDDGNGVDCSGAVWAAYRYAWSPSPAPFPLSSTSGYAAMAQHYGLWVPINNRQRGDILLHSSNGDVFNSDGPVGHTEIDSGQSDSRGRWLCYGSSGSGQGVGVQPRARSFWQARLRIPGLQDITPNSPPPKVITIGDVTAILAAVQPQSQEDDMQQPVRIPYNGGLHTFWVDVNGRLKQKLDSGNGATQEFDLTSAMNLGPLADIKPTLGISPDGDLLVGVYGVDHVFNDVRWDTQSARWVQWFDPTGSKK